MKLYSDQYIPSKVRTGTSDLFALELLELWENRSMQGQVFVVEDKKQTLVGFLLLEDNRFNTYTIRGTWVSEEFRGQKIGSKLLGAVFKSIPKTSIVHVNITPGAEGFYAKYGFKLVGSRSDFGQTLGVYAENLSQNTCEILARNKVGESVYVAPKKEL